MEETAPRDQERPKDTDDYSNRAMLPHAQPPSNQQSHRITNFCIDNILRPDFGRKSTVRTLVRERDGPGVIIPRKELPERKLSKSGTLQQGGAGDETEVECVGLSDNRLSDTDTRSPDLITSDVAVKGRDGGGNRYVRAQANSCPKTMLWPAWVYCTRYSDRPSSGWCAHPLPLTKTEPTN